MEGQRDLGTGPTRARLGRGEPGATFFVDAQVRPDFRFLAARGLRPARCGRPVGLADPTGPDGGFAPPLDGRGVLELGSGTQGWNRRRQVLSE